MRISNNERRCIVDSVARHIADNAKVWLFGSRCDDNKYGGDIDLYIESDKIDDPFMARIHFKIALEDALGFQKFDLVYHQRQKPLQPIHEIAKSEGVLLNFRTLTIPTSK